MKPFAEGKISASGKLLPFSEFRLFSDLDKTAAPNARRMEAIIQAAEASLETEIPTLPASVYRQFAVNGNRSNYESIYFKRRTMAVNLTLAEYYEKKGRFAEKLMDVVWAIMEESSWIIPAHLAGASPYGGHKTLPPVYGDNLLHGIDLFAATTGAQLALTLYLCRESLDAIAPIVCEKLTYMLHDRILKPFLHCTFWWTGDTGGKPNNWNPWIISNVLLVSAVIATDMTMRERLANRSMQILDQFMNGYQSDGGCDEGPSYWGGAGASLFDSLEILEDMSGGAISIYQNPLVRAIGEYIFKVNINDDYFVNFADCAPRPRHDGNMISRYGEKCGSEYLAAFGRKMSRIADAGVGYSHMYRGVKSLHQPDVPKDEVCPAPLSTWLDGIKVMTARASHDSSKGIFLAIKGGHNAESHNHNDIGNFVVYYDGKPVLIDTGVGTYTKQTFSNRRYELWFMQSGYHNLPSFGGIDQRNGPMFRSSDEAYSEKDGIKMEISAAYPPEAELKSYTREAKLSDSTVTVTDTFSLSEAKEVDFHFMCHREPTLDGNGTIRLAEGRVLLFDPRLSARIEEFDPVGMITTRNWGTEKFWRIHMTVTAAEGSFTFTVR